MTKNNLELQSPPTLYVPVNIGHTHTHMTRVYVYPGDDNNNNDPDKGPYWVYWLTRPQAAPDPPIQLLMYNDAYYIHTRTEFWPQAAL